MFECHYDIKKHKQIMSVVAIQINYHHDTKKNKQNNVILIRLIAYKDSSSYTNECLRAFKN